MSITLRYIPEKSLRVTGVWILLVTDLVPASACMSVMERNKIRCLLNSMIFLYMSIAKLLTNMTRVLIGHFLFIFVVVIVYSIR